MQKLINEIAEKYNLSYTVKSEIEILVATAILKGKQDENNFNSNISNNICQLCRNSQRN